MILKLLIITLSFLFCSSAYSGTPLARISAGLYHTVGVSSAGKMYSWGGINGPMGGWSQSITQVGTDSNWSYSADKFVATSEHNKAIKTTGALYVWGKNEVGQLGLGDTTDRGTPTQIGAATNWSKLSRAFYHGHGINTSGEMYGAGLNDAGQLGYASSDTCTLNSVSVACSKTWTKMGTDTNWSSVTGGLRFTIAIKTNGTMWGWGQNDAGQCGVGDWVSHATPVQIGSGNTWSKVSCGTSHCMALKTDGSLWGWGYNAWGQLGNLNTQNQNSPVAIGMFRYIDVSVGYYYNLAITDDAGTAGMLHGWGKNDVGQLGTATPTFISVPTVISWEIDWVEVGAGYESSTGRKSDGTVYVWGSGNYGQNGNYSAANLTDPNILGTYYFVDYAGGSDSNEGRLTSAAWKHCPGDATATGTPAATTLTPGDKVIFKGGVVYNPTVTDYGMFRMPFNGSGDLYNKRIVYDGDSGTYATRWGSGTNKAILDGTNSVYVFWIWVSGGIGHYTTINNFEMRNLQSGGTFGGAGAVYQYAAGVSYVTISNNSIHTNGSYVSDTTATGTAISFGMATYIKIINNTIYDNYSLGISVGNSSNVDIGYNTLYGFTTWPLTVACNGTGTFSNINIYNNTLYNIGKGMNPPSGLHSNWIWLFSEANAGMTDAKFNNLRIYNNKLYNDYTPSEPWGTGFIHISAGGDGGTGIWDGVYLYNNVLFNGGQYATNGMDINSRYGGIRNMHIYNNSFYNDATVTGSMLNLMLADYAGAAFTNLYVKNNVFYQGNTGSGTANYPARSQVNGDYIIDYNLYYLTAPNPTLFMCRYDDRLNPACAYSWSAWQALGYDTHGVGLSTNPNFTSITPASFNLALSATSPAQIRTDGANLGSSYATDILGVTRGAGNWSFGAYQYQPCVGDCVAPVVTISTANPSNISANTLAVAGTASDAVGVSSCKYRVGSPPDGSNGTSCTGTTPWSCDTSSYSGGKNTLYVGCVDAAGNWGSNSITVNYNPLGDSEAPTVTISTSSPQAIASNSLTVTGTASDNVSVSGCKWKVSTEPIPTEGTPCTGTTAWSCATSGYSSGNNSLYIECFDSVPNYSTGHSIVVNYTPPPVEGVEAHSLYIRGGKIE